MKILIVALSESIHTARWIAQIADQGWEIHLFPSIDWRMAHPDLKNVTIHHSVYGKQESSDQSVKFCGVPVYSKYGVALGRCLIKKYFPDYRVNQLARVINGLRPDIIHSMEIQHSAYLTLKAKKLLTCQFPPWIVTNWGSDIYLFGRLSEHEPKIREVLSKCDYYSCECKRDVLLAQSFGFKGDVLPVFPNTGGFDLEDISMLRQQGPVSKRRIIMLKGYQGWAGRALVGLRAIERCPELVEGYQVVIYSINKALEVKIAAELLTKSTGIPIKIIPDTAPHQEILKLHGQARISIGLSISDAISTSLLEAMAMGSFPIQSNTSCADEWIVDGETGILVHPDDPEIVELAIRRALTDDFLVEQAAKKNFRTISEKLNKLILKPKVIEMYQQIYKKHQSTGQGKSI